MNELSPDLLFPKLEIMIKPKNGLGSTAHLWIYACDFDRLCGVIDTRIYDIVTVDVINVNHNNK